MHKNKYGQIILDERDLCDLYMQDPDRIIRRALVDRAIDFGDLELTNKPELAQYVEPQLSVEEFDRQNQANWHMPDEYKNLDIAEWILAQCKNEAQLQRAGQELLMYLERGMFPLLQYLKFLVDTMRLNNIVWGVGRGSSVASFVLYLIGVHRIDSIYYDLDIHEFLR
jgi:DNA polymerase III alpha subunit